MAALSSTDADDPSEEKILDVWICKMPEEAKALRVRDQDTGGRMMGDAPRAGREIARPVIAA